MGKRIKPIGIVICVMAVLMAILSSCDKETVDEKILGTWTLTSDPSCTWTFLNETANWKAKKCVISVDTFKAITCYYEIENNTLKLNSNTSYHEPNIYVEDSYISIDDIAKEILHISGYIRIYEINDNYDRSNYNANISYEFRKLN